MRQAKQKRLLTQLLNRITTNGQMDLKKIPLLSKIERETLVLAIVRDRQPVVKDLIPEIEGEYLGYKSFRAWMFAMGYTETTEGSRYTFVHLSSHKIR